MAAPIRRVFALQNCYLKFYNVRCQKFSTSHRRCEVLTPATETQDVGRSMCRTSETDVNNHTQDHEGLFFNLSENDRNRFYTKGQSTHLKQMFTSFNESCIMVRKPMLELKSLLNATDNNLPVIRYILYGRLGNGKSLSMAYIMHHCAMKDWLVIHLPWAAQMTRAWREHQASPFQPGKVDNPIDAADWLAYFYSLNKPFIEKHQPVVDDSYVWTKRESVEAGSPWTDVIDFGISRNKYACDAVGILFKEIKKQANENRYKVLIAVDGVNTFWEPTTIKREDNRSLKYDASELTFLHYFKKMLRNDWRNGAVVCTVDERASTTFKKDSHMPLYLLGREGFEFFNPCIPIEVPIYSDKEAYSQLQYYAEMKWIQNPEGLTDEGRKELVFLSGASPYEMYTVTRGW